MSPTPRAPAGEGPRGGASRITPAGDDERYDAHAVVGRRGARDQKDALVLAAAGGAAIDALIDGKKGAGIGAGRRRPGSRGSDDARKGRGSIRRGAGAAHRAADYRVD
jgi:hypothetical protein